VDHGAVCHPHRVRACKKRNRQGRIICKKKTTGA
jgi:hypothetical protein